MAILGWALNLYRRKVDVLEKAHTSLLTTYVSRKDLDKKLEEIAAARQTMHTENSRKLERIEDELRAGFGRIHDRIDQIPFRTPTSRTRSTDERRT